MCSLCKSSVCVLTIYADGLSIGYLSGTESGNVKFEKDDVKFLVQKGEENNDSMDPNFRPGIDILLTGEWPEGMSSFVRFEGLKVPPRFLIKTFG